jgi:pyridinium-3,5-biscarboxylic acid mononucleotide sulfurtransferase
MHARSGIQVPNEMTRTTHTKLDALRAQLRAHAPLVIAYSGGVDSTYLLAEAHRTLGSEGVLGAIADSASLPRAALSEALAVAREIGARLEVVPTTELSNPEYAANPPNRCYFCKAELFTQLDALATERGFRAIAYGENADDMKQVRPGRKAATEFAILAPLRDAGLTKAEIREFSRELGLPTADAPAQPCLSSRIPWGTPVTPEALAMIERAEAAVRALGFRVFRVRHVVSGGTVTARVLIAPEEMPRLDLTRAEIVRRLQDAGYASVDFDPHGYRSSNPAEASARGTAA